MPIRMDPGVLHNALRDLVLSLLSAQISDDYPADAHPVQGDVAQKPFGMLNYHFILTCQILNIPVLWAEAEAA
jgi:hypothetical protein